jgi:LAO/AO transport system kinase
MLVSGLANEGLEALWAQVLEHRRRMTACGDFAARRRAQQTRWMWTMVEDRLLSRLRTDPAVRARLPALEAAVASGELSPTVAAEEIVGLLEPGEAPSP